ncbi:hypothetical protein DL93DRAFT_355458 [Clavulina sp. PMI_390]|nr:hypothetical protein DL93DRAFT_355458 [Clavulina sp. PMI_390]
MAAACAMRATCGSVGWGGPALPCPYDGPPIEPETSKFRDKLVDVCGLDYSTGPVCCSSEQLDSLASNLNQAEALISSCPACRNNFRDFFCSFTCSPNQASFVNVTSTQITSTDETAVETVDYYVGSHHAQGFFDSCKDIKFGATNGYAMELLGGGAKSYQEFFQFLGDVRPGLGSPFQINFPGSAPSTISPYDPPPRSCAGTDLASRCTCIDCPSVCSVLPSIPPPGEEPYCHVGLMSCLTFVLVLTYALSLFSFLSGYGIVTALRKRRGSAHGRIRLLHGRTPSIQSGGSPDTPTSGHLVGATSLGGYYDDNVSLGRGASLLDPDNLQQRQYRLNTILRRWFYRLGYFCASSPFITLFLACIFVAGSNAGWKFFSVEKDPVRLWVPPTSESRANMDFFDEHFGPFYRAEQIFLTRSPSSAPADDPSDISPILSYDSLKWWFSFESRIRSLETSDGTTLEDVCFKPDGPDGACVVQSISGWFDMGDLSPYNSTSWRRRAQGCARQPVLCLPDFGQPLDPQYVLGGIPKNEDDTVDISSVLESKALVMSLVVENSADPAKVARAEAWEIALRKYLENEAVPSALRDHGYQLSFSTEVSLEEELNKSTNTDITTVVISYVFMFLYVSLTLGRGEGSPEEQRASFPRLLINLVKRTWRSADDLPASSSVTSFRTGSRSLLRRLFVHSKVVLGLFAIILVLTSIASAIGIFSYLGVKVTLIIAEVIPFLVLAVGVDNVFLLLAELERQNASHGPNAQQLLGGGGGPAAPGYRGLVNPMSPQQRQREFDAGPAGMASDYYAVRSPPLDDVHSGVGSGSATLSAEERVARTLAKMGPSLLLSTSTQTVAFALGALVPMPAVRNFALYAAGSVLVNAGLQITVFVSALALDLRRAESSRVDCFPFIRIPARISLQDAFLIPAAGGILARFFRRVYAPFILHPSVKGTVIAIFAGMAVSAGVAVQHLELGLDQRLALPADSYLVNYFNAVESYLEFGPPVYFVVDGLNVSDRSAQQSLCSRFTTCSSFSVGNTLEAERKRPASSFLSQPPAVWIDEFFRWLDPAIDTCCRVRIDDPSVFCSERDSEKKCRPCWEGHDPAWNITMEGLPLGEEEFGRYLLQWLRSPANENCPLGGKTAYKDALSVVSAPDGSDARVQASHFRTYHSPLRTQADFIHAYAAAHRIANDLTSRMSSQSPQEAPRVFPYSPFYVFFEQYSYIAGTAQEVLGLGLGAALLMTSLLLGSWRVGTIVTAVVGLAVLNIMGVMALWGISLNAISLVNLVISLGIAVEFCSHIARGYMSSGGSIVYDGFGGQKERDERVFATLVDIGPSVSHLPVEP